MCDFTVPPTSTALSAAENVPTNVGALSKVQGPRSKVQGGASTPVQTCLPPQCYGSILKVLEVSSVVLAGSLRATDPHPLLQGHRQLPVAKVGAMFHKIPWATCRAPTTSTAR